ncbi:hypothetical protein D3C83_95570 [compost metagenome]
MHQGVIADVQLQLELGLERLEQARLFFQQVERDLRVHANRDFLFRPLDGDPANRPLDPANHDFRLEYPARPAAFLARLGHGLVE